MLDSILEGELLLEKSARADYVIRKDGMARMWFDLGEGTDLNAIKLARQGRFIYVVTSVMATLFVPGFDILCGEIAVAVNDGEHLDVIARQCVRQWQTD